MIIGIVGAIVSQYFITKIKPQLPIDDVVDAFGCHGVSGIWGSIATGIFASHQISHLVPNGLFIWWWFAPFARSNLRYLIDNYIYRCDGYYLNKTALNCFTGFD